MSYKDTVISDHPIAYYAIDDFNSVLFPACLDYSGCGNDGVYIGTPSLNALPIVSGNEFSHKIDNLNSIEFSILNDYNGSDGIGGFGQEGYSDNDFSLEVWIKPFITTNSLITIMADETNNIGIFYQKGNIVFSVDSEVIEYSLLELNKTAHIVCTYTPTTISIYIDSVLCAQKQVLGINFTNTSLNLSSGPTTSSSDSFLINSVAIYRYALNQKSIINHYIKSESIPPVQVSLPDEGRLFEIFDDQISTKYTYSYPANKAWNYFINEDLYYNPNEQSLSILATPDVQSKSIEIIDFVSIPSGIPVDSSKIEWAGDNGVSVFISLDGITYEECTNNAPIPNYRLGDFNSDIDFYFKLVLTTTDSSRFLPKISYLSFSFYDSQTKYSLNSADYITTMYGDTGPTNFDISIGNKKHSILTRNKYNGITAFDGSGFYINTELDTSTIEFFYTPSDISTGALISSVVGTGAASSYSWSSNTISKSNVSAIYVNGLAATSQTTANSIFTSGQLHHVVIVYTNPISGKIKFNYSLAGSKESIYQNISLYSEAFNSTKAIDHYNFYMGNTTAVADDSSLSVTENSINYYNNDWKVVQSV